MHFDFKIWLKFIMPRSTNFQYVSNMLVTHSGLLKEDIFENNCDEIVEILFRKGF